MQLAFNKETQQISIKDDVPTHSWLIIVLMLVNVLNMSVQLFYISFDKNEMLFIFMALLGFGSLVAVLFYLLKKSWKKTYKLTEIEGLEIKENSGIERIALKLKNGKTRSFSKLKNKTELKSLKKTLTAIGIKSI
ncbi:hypothetical protein [Tenacibaculum finnmarkense]|uniref:Uncharacterized protein n=1 Tax=Tenacibaculum finnmarkense genomovar ulcerans TaxID=2781388 RepID=A0A2I2M6E9_9FLAO|nr:hypothetical protein [Tenacibaculum finnmarkense]ALU76021.1 hypothetical protein AUW17_12520 [Tenacibaculum dicentrarchi]MBE7633489.1 hypothetical protein [Tenacibaculum finnmarkense genomovar ulcerans]MBE7647282.1 hypothetical protein [Tenacibaculum finnmarkense genomovar ulcerans]MBE7687055.1 hypothetical protein [Tenacibaculum finnmarkense genomovar ulcerans]MBE7696616.1 hypothetical protein [Tenacibaculum finnmarkense genomovar ulcerans]